MATLQVTVSGSFRRFLPQVEQDIEELESWGADVLSPVKPRVVGWIDDFVFLEGDRTNIAQAVQARHLKAIERSAFVWLVAPDGYVGTSATFEVSWAAAHGVPVLCLTRPRNCVITPYVTVVSSIAQAVARRSAQSRADASRAAPSILIDPVTGSELALRAISDIRTRLSARQQQPVTTDPVLANSARQLRTLLELL